ncbi:MAG: amidohydrolase [Pseudomonadota bacterium]
MSDLILHNAHVITMDTRRPFGELVAIRDGKITAVTGNYSLNSLATPKTQVIDCGGRTLLPGFIDAHCHLRAFAESLLTLDLHPAAGIGSISDIRSRIDSQAKALPMGTWIRGHGYHEFDLIEKRHPTRLDLDAVSPHHPVKLSHRTGHAHVLNSLALQVVGLSRYSDEPDGGIMDRDSNTGEPTGLLYEMGNLLAERIPRIAENEMEQGIGRASHLLLSHGITSLYDASEKNDRRQWERFVHWKNQGHLAQKIGMFFNPAAMEWISDGPLCYRTDPRHLHPLGIKIILDETTGKLHPETKELYRLVTRAHTLGLQVSIHAVEENAIEAGCATIEKVLLDHPRSDHRHRLEHVFICPPHLIARLSAIGIHVVTQPGFLRNNGDRYLKTVPEEKQGYLYPIGSLMKGGITVAAGSDCPVGPPNPFAGLQAAVSRTTITGKSIGARECISLLDAIALYTSNAARTAFEETIKGSIALGKTADLILLGADLLRSEIERVQVDLTILDGKIAWARKSFDIKNQ